MLRCCEGTVASGPSSGGRRQSLGGETLAAPRHKLVLQQAYTKSPTQAGCLVSVLFGCPLNKVGPLCLYS